MSNAKPGVRKEPSVNVLLILMALLFVLSSCASVPTVKQEVLDSYQPEMVPGENETLVYVFRQSTLLGAAMTVSVGYNDKLVGTLITGSYTAMKAEAGIVTVQILQGPSPVAQYNVDFRPGETVYLYYEYSKGTLREVPREQGIAMILKFSKREPLAQYKPNPNFVNSLLNPGITNVTYMKPAVDILEPDSEHGVITFIRGSRYAKEFAIGIWNQDNYLGSLKGETYFQIKVPPGKHTFLGKLEQWSVLEGEVEAGKNYYVQVTYSMGWSQGHVRLLPVDEQNNSSKTGEWMKASKHVTLDRTAVDKTMKAKVALALPYIQETMAKVQAGSIETRKLQ